MTVLTPNLSSWNYLYNPTTRTSIKGSLTFTTMSSKYSPFSRNTQKESFKSLIGHHSYCPCCARRHFLGSVLGTGFFSVSSSFASSPDDSLSMLNRIHPPRPDWYEEFYASAMDKTMRSYEEEVEGYKAQLFSMLRGKADMILEIGIGTGPNFKYYAEYRGVDVFGVDPNRKMEKYARVSAEASGIPSSNFIFKQAVAEALPLNDASVDAVLGTLVLCSVKDVDQTLREVKRVLKPGGLYIFVEHVGAKDGTILRLIQGILDPLQQTVADGCHLTRNTGTNIAKAGFAGVDINQVVLSSIQLISPHVYGVARR